MKPILEDSEISNDSMTPSIIKDGDDRTLKKDNVEERSIEIILSMKDDDGLLSDDEEKLSMMKDDTLSTMKDACEDEELSQTKEESKIKDTEGDEESNHNVNNNNRGNFIYNKIGKMTQYQLYFLIGGIILSSIFAILIIVFTAPSKEEGIILFNGFGSNNNNNPIILNYNTKKRNEPERYSPPLPPVFDDDMNNNNQTQQQVEQQKEPWDENNLKALLENYSSKSLLEDDTTPQGQAYKWILDDNTNNVSKERIQQRYILAVFYLCYHTDEWNNNGGWLSHTQHECTWYGIHCGSQQQLQEDLLSETITHIDLKGNNLQNLMGGLPLELSYLTDLVQLILSKNYIDGSIPSNFFSKLTNLHTLYLDENFFTGQLPNDFHNLISLQNLAVHDNTFHGPIPDSIQFASNLVDIRLQNNQFKGTLPDNFFNNMSNLRVFLAGKNRLEGTIPSSLSSTSSALTSVQLHKNNLRGTIPDFKKSTQLRQLHLDHNGLLEGPIPDLSPSIEELRLEHNSFNGTVPTSFGTECTNLDILWLNNNFFTGTIPTELGNLTKLVTLKLGRNSFHGSVPSEICMLRQSSAELSNFTAIDCIIDNDDENNNNIRQPYSFTFQAGDNNELECNCCDNC